MGVSLVLGLSSLVGGQDGLDELVYGGARLGGFSLGDIVGSALWSVSLFYASPVQLLLLFLGRIDAERPSDATARFLGRALFSLPVDDASFEPPPLLLAANASLYAVFGTVTALALSRALGGEATWAVSGGIGSALAAAVYELGRPPRLSGTQQVELEAQWSEFRAFANARLQKKGRCHASEVEAAYRKFSPAYRKRRESPGATANAANDEDLRNFLVNWHRGAERTAGGFYKNLSVLSEAELRANRELAASAEAVDAGTI